MLDRGISGKNSFQDFCQRYKKTTLGIGMKRFRWIWGGGKSEENKIPRDGYEKLVTNRSRRPRTTFKENIQ